MALVGIQYEPVSVLKKNGISLIHVKNQEKVSRCGKWDAMHTNVEYLSCGEVEALGCFQLSDMRYDDRNMVTERVSTTVLQLYLIWKPAQILEHVIEFQRQM